jgi:ATP-dependent Clp protease ATP-binding subunit ClpA
MGVLREDAALVNRFLMTSISEEMVRLRTFPKEALNDEFREEQTGVTFSDESNQVLCFASEEADLMSKSQIGVEQLFLGLLRPQDGSASQILREGGADLDSARMDLKAVPYTPRPDKERLAGEVDRIRKRLEREEGPGAEPLTDRFWNFTEEARRSIFFARYEASQFHSPLVETYQLLLGVLRVGVPRFDLFMPLASSKESLRIQIAEYAAVREKVSVSPGLPLSEECERALTNAEEEAGKLGHSSVGPEHLLLGLLREESSFAAQLLRERGAEIGRIRSGLAASSEQPPPNPEDHSLPSSSDPAA